MQRGITSVPHVPSPSITQYILLFHIKSAETVPKRLSFLISLLHLELTNSTPSNSIPLSHMLSTRALSNAISTEPAPKLKKRQINLKQKHECLFYPFCLHGMQITAVSMWMSPQPLSGALSYPWTCSLLWSMVPAGMGFAFPSFSLPPYPCSIQMLPSTSLFSSPSLPTRSFQHVSHPLLHSGVSPMPAQSQTHPSRLERPHCKHGAENITAGGFLQCEPNKTQTLPNNCYLQLK